MPSIIPVLEDKYNVSEGLDQLVEEGGMQKTMTTTTTVSQDGVATTSTTRHTVTFADGEEDVKVETRTSGMEAPTELEGEEERRFEDLVREQGVAAVETEGIVDEAESLTTEGTNQEVRD